MSSPLEPAAAAASPQRHHPATAVFNLRDLGGYPTTDGRTTRWGRLYRADGLHRTDAEGAAVVAALGIRRVIDLRTAEERANDGLFSHPEVHNEHAPILDALWDLGEMATDREADFLLVGYRAMASQHGARLGRVLQAIAEHGHQPLVFHCAAGKDRTGVIAALLLALVGVDDDTIAADFALSAPAAQQMAAWYQLHRSELMAQRHARLGFDGDKAMRLLSADPATIVRFLQELRQAHGSIEAFAAAHGVDDAIVEELRRHALEPGSSAAGPRQA